MAAAARALRRDEGWDKLAPGLTIAILGTLAAGFLSDHYGPPLTLMALLIGLALNFLSVDQRLAAGLSFASRSLLRGGVILVGVRITFGQIVALGPVALLGVLVIVASTIGTGILMARRLGLRSPFGVLAGGSVAICGASAAMAIATMLGERRISRAQLTLVLVGISALSATAMVLYPLVARATGLDDLGAGFFLGASIHDVAQALGAGYSYSTRAGEIATIVKLTRVALLAPLLGLLSLFLPATAAEGRRIEIPWFVLGFFLMAGVNSLGAIPSFAASAAEHLATAMLATAVTATAIRSPLRELLGASAAPLLVIGGSTLAAMLLALAAAAVLIGRIPV